ncbi:MAG: cytidine deaminase [Bacteroidales bacterium]|nr:cytidine deaminase [Bacteroidales bacterium]
MKSFNIETRVVVAAFEELSTEDQALIEHAKEVALGAYAPYSRFHVGAAAQLDNGEVVVGSNQENAAFPSSLCAERTALFSAGARYPTAAVTTLAVAAYTEGNWLKQPISPCGACRQVLLGSELRGKRPMRVLLYGSEAVFILERAADLLPFSFTGDDLPE